MDIGDFNFKYSRKDIRPLSELRLDKELWEQILTAPDFLQEYEMSMIIKDKIESNRIELMVAFYKEKGNLCYRSKRYIEAINCYQKAVQTANVSNKELLFPVLNFYNKDYIAAFENDDPRERSFKYTTFLDLVSSCNNIAQIKIQAQKFTEAIDWLQEIEIMYGCLNTLLAGEFDGQLPKVTILEYTTLRMKTALRLVYLFSRLRNTGTAAYFAFRCTKFYTHWYPEDLPEIRTIMEQCNADSHYQFRHPDLSGIQTWDLVDPSLQVRGIWNRLEVNSKTRTRPFRRPNSASWVWRGRLYLCGGYNFLEIYDTWCLDLKRSRKWRRLPDIPEHLRSMRSICPKTIVHGDFAWFFMGRLNVLRFNLISETWDTIKTTIDTEWPFNEDVAFDTYVELYQDKLCVLGGYDDFQHYQRRIFIALDLTSLNWEHLEELDSDKDKTAVPQPRTGGMSWVATKEDCLFLAYGEFSPGDFDSTPERKFLREDVYSDIWSYNFRNRKWTRERFRGNFPCRREHMGAEYHVPSDSVIAFGGMNDKIPSYNQYVKKGVNVPKNSNSTVFGDTFIMDVRTRTWKQVVTRGFPAWRSGARVLIDKEDGNVYLFGGRTNLFGQAQKPYSLNDVWHLDIDLPGHHFEESTFHKFSPNLKIGAWRVCYTCKRIGTGFLKCNGTCGGKYNYCSVACQQNAWPIHRNIHGCRKLYEYRS